MVVVDVGPSRSPAVAGETSGLAASLDCLSMMLSRKVSTLIDIQQLQLYMNNQS